MPVRPKENQPRTAVSIICSPQLNMVFFLLLAAQLATAHFALEYPSWQADTLNTTNTTTTKNYSQWTYPCR